MPTQLEMFDAGDGGQAKKKNFFASRNAPLEGKIILIISCVIIAIVAFSLGIEKGKRINAPIEVKIDNVSRKDFVRKDIILDKPNLMKSASVNENNIAKVNIVSQARPSAGNYTIQIASFAEQDNAAREVERFAKKGYKTFTINKGKFTLLCLGNFSSMEEARGSQELKSVKQIIKDYYIRKL
jgi:hypothetical protein